MANGTYMWVQMVSFSIGDAAAPDRDVIAAVLAHRRYRDHCAGPFEDQDFHDLHGPYRIESITPVGFELIENSEAMAVLQRWLCDAISPTHQDSIAESLRLVDLHVRPAMVSADTLYRFVVPRDGNEHDWGWVPGGHGFHEFLAIDRTEALVTMIIACDD